MATASTSPSSEPASPTAHLSPLRGLIDVFVNPAALFERLRDRPDWLIPLLVGSCVLLVVQYFLHPYSSRAALGMITDSTPPQMAQALREQATKPPGWTLLFQPFGYVLFCLIGAGILTGLAAMFTAKGKFKPIFSAFVYAKLVVLPALLLSLLIVRLRGVESVNSMMDVMWTLGPAMFVTDNKLLFNVLTQINLFEAWYVILLVIAIQKITGGSRGSSIAVVAIYWILGAATQIGALMLSGLK
jgi:hypothetical protein